jgi:hypothetical protein
MAAAHAAAREARDLPPARRLQASRAHRFRKRFGELKQQQ